MNGASMEPCLEAIAAGDGREIMQFDEDSPHSFLCIICDSTGVCFWERARKPIILFLFLQVCAKSFAFSRMGRL